MSRLTSLLKACFGGWLGKNYLVRVGIFSWLHLANPTGVIGSQCCRKAIKIGLMNIHQEFRNFSKPASSLEAIEECIFGLCERMPSWYSLCLARHD